MRGTAPPGHPRLRWVMLLMAFLGTMVVFVGRSGLGAAMPFVGRDLHLGPAGAGLALSAFFWTYTPGQLPAGYLVDRLGARVTLAASLAWWSVTTAAVAATNGLLALVGARLATGAGEASIYSGDAKVVAEWFPIRERAFASSVYDSGALLGSALALPVMALAGARLGWRAAFLLIGGLGAAWVLAWVFLPAHGRTVQPDPRPGAAPGPAVRWADLFRYRTIWGMMLGLFCINFVAYFFITWFPDYLVTARHYDLAALGSFGAIPLLMAIPGGLAGGLVSDRLARSGMGLSAARKTCTVTGLLGSSVIALAVFAPSSGEALTLLTISNACLMFAAASVWALPADVAPSPDLVSSIGGIQNCAANLAGIVGPASTGMMVEFGHGSFTDPLLATGGVAVVGAAAYLFVVGRVESLPSSASERR